MGTPISLSLLEKNSNIKVFDEAYGEVKLWTPVANFIIDLYKQH